MQAAFALSVLLRSPERRAATPEQWSAAVPSLLLAGLLLRSAGGVWDTARLAVAVVGAAVTFSGLASLGRSFAVMPGVRELRVGGAYAVVRHPIYLGECVVAAAAAAGLGWIGVGAWAGLVAAVAWRIRAEEALLSPEPGWREWAVRVPWQLVPGVW